MISSSLVGITHTLKGLWIVLTALTAMLNEQPDLR